MIGHRSVYGENKKKLKENQTDFVLFSFNFVVVVIVENI